MTLRVSLIEPGAVDTELVSRNRPEIQERHRERFAQTQRMAAADIAETIAFVITRPRHMSINEVLVRPNRAGQLGQRRVGGAGVVMTEKIAP